MPEGPLQAAGAQIEPTSSASLHTNEFFTGMFTQGNPLGPGPVPYLYQKFYLASRYDRLIGGSNVEMSVQLTPKRRVGHSMYNNTVASAVQRFYFFRGFNAAGANNRLLGDLGATVNDITAGGSTVLYNKAAGAGRACFQGVGNTCYIGDGQSNKKYVLPGKSWIADTVYSFGDLIVDTNGNVQVAKSMLTLNITCVQVVLYGGSYYAIVTFEAAVKWAAATNITFSGLQAYVGLNGQTLPVANVVGISINPDQAVFLLAGVTAIYGPAGDVGSGTSQPAATKGESGNAAPVWAAGAGNYTTDGNLVWRCFGSQVMPWGVAAPAVPPIVTISNSVRLWQPNVTFLNLTGAPVIFWAIIDSNGNVELLLLAAHQQVQTGPSEPTWSQVGPSSTTSPGVTPDGTAIWTCAGPILGWVPNFAYYQYQTLLDSNGNLQVCTTAGTTGAAMPAWATAQGSTTNDNTVVWTNLGPGVTLLTGLRQYAYAYHTIAGQVSTISDLVPLNASGYTIGPQGAILATVQGPVTAQPDIDEVWIFATAQGGALPELLDKFPNQTPGAASTFAFFDSFPDKVLNELILGPQNDANDPPPAGFVPAGFHLGLVCGFVNDVLYYSNGTAAVGNPNESFPPNNSFQLPSIAVAGWSTSIGFVVLRVDGISIMLGSNTASAPLYVVNIFDGVGLAGRDAYATRGNAIYIMTTTGKVLRLSTTQFISAIEGGVNQTLPDDEVGFPIGDLLAELNPADCCLAWLEGPSSDSGLFVCDGATGWYMMRVLREPEEALPWSPFATITGGLSSICAIQTAPGVNSLLVGTPGGPVWKRDLTKSDDNGTAYTAFMTISNIVLAQPGSTVEVQFVATEERTIAGATPAAVGVLFDEISGTFLNLKNVSNEPPNLVPPSKSVTAQRFWASQSAGTVQVCRHMQQQISWPAESYPNELLTNTIYGKLPQKARK